MPTFAQEIFAAGYSSKFALAMERTFKHEGSLNHVVGDKGGLTNFGITKPFLTDYLGRPATDADIRSLKASDACAAYFKLVWQREGLENLDAALGAFMFDWIVNSGPGVKKELQRAVGAKDDGNIGPITVRKIYDYSRGKDGLLVAMVARRLQWCARFVEREPVQIKFFEGWVNRIVTYIPGA